MSKQKPKKVSEEPYNNAEMYRCERCKCDAPSEGWYCDCCNPQEVVDFEVIEDGVNKQGDTVCPWCYNQLVDVKNGK